MTRPGRLFTGLVALCGIMGPGFQRASAQDTLDALLTRLTVLPHATHSSEIRVDATPGSDLQRFWINSNEDDTRLYTPTGGQLDVDFQVSALARPGDRPATVSILIETRGAVQPGTGPRTLTLRAGERRLTFSQHENPSARSGPLLFLSLQAEISLAEFLTLVTAPAVDGRIWDVPFRLLPVQLELLRAWARRVTGIDR